MSLVPLYRLRRSLELRKQFSRSLDQHVHLGNLMRAEQGREFGQESHSFGFNDREQLLKRSSDFGYPLSRKADVLFGVGPSNCNIEICKRVPDSLLPVS
jgi:hypothetical protein